MNAATIDLAIVAAAVLADRLAAKVIADRDARRARQAAETAAMRKHDLACRRALAASVKAKNGAAS